MFTPGEWAVFMERVKGGDFDVLAASPRSSVAAEPLLTARP